jgi:uracil-DNA glycosylase
MTTCSFNFDIIDPSWKECLERSIQVIDRQYLSALACLKGWLPGPDKIFNAFSLPLNKVNYVLFGESPYPRPESANGYAFWDASVHELWSSTGLSKKVNRATSLRNILKMLLIAEGQLKEPDTTQEAIAKIDKSEFVETNDQLFNNLLNHGFLLLNATLVLANSPQKDAKAWHPFMHQLLDCLIEKRPSVKFILLGRIANQIEEIMPKEMMNIDKLCSPHPYNISFITNSNVINFFKPLHLLRKNQPNIKSL